MTRARPHALCGKRVWRYVPIAIVAVAATGPARAAENDDRAKPADSSPPQTEPAPLWQPGESTTSPVEPRVETDEGPPTPGWDGAYGRFEGDVDLGVNLGAEIDEHGPSAVAALSAHYYWMAGVTVTYVDAFGSDEATSSRLLAVGVDLRPAFVPRWSENHEHGPGAWDLLIDSISVGVGVFWASPVGGSFGDRRGFEASAGFGLPLLGKAEGLWLQPRGVLRWADPTHEDDAAVPAGMLTLAWHEALQVR